MRDDAIFYFHSVFWQIMQEEDFFLKIGMRKSIATEEVTFLFMQIRFLIPHLYPFWSEQPEADFILLVGDFCFSLAPAGPVFWVFAFLSQ